MNRANFIENLIYLILTSVQVCLLGLNSIAAPNLNPPPSSFPSESSEDVPMTQQERSKAPLESMVISDPNYKRPLSTASTLPSFKKNRISLVTGYYLGPQRESKSMLLIGLDYQHPLDFSLWNHLGFTAGNGANPLFYFSQESFLRNYWKYLKSWQYLIQLELDTTQGLGAFVSVNHYMGGLGLNFYVFENCDFQFNLIPFSSRGMALELKFKYLIF